jgi:hypothetical protein
MKQPSWYFLLLFVVINRYGAWFKTVAPDGKRPNRVIPLKNCFVPETPLAATRPKLA